MEIVAYIIGTALGGLLWGLIPYFYGRSKGKPCLGRLALICCTLAGPLMVAFPVSLGFIIAIKNRQTDYWPRFLGGTGTQPTAYQAPQVTTPVYQSTASVTCLSGPLKGRVYSLGPGGLLFGSNPECGVCFPAGTPGVSRRHCMLQQNGAQVVLTDLGSSYGTFLSNGTKLPPQYPTQVGSGSRFYLATTACMFQVNI